MLGYVLVANSISHRLAMGEAMGLLLTLNQTVPGGFFDGWLESTGLQSDTARGKPSSSRTPTRPPSLSKEQKGSFPQKKSPKILIFFFKAFRDVLALFTWEIIMKESRGVPYRPAEVSWQDQPS